MNWILGIAIVAQVIVALLSHGLVRALAELSAFGLTFLLCYRLRANKLSNKQTVSSSEKPSR
ncbi:hypothetical protein VHP8226_01936 [Vibrio hippocampi]|uniref:O-succinylbenzoic acid--CoA ligase n=1 Tax=Vibrio hippocampi TaxID=654686 RepID=A0ABM8ZIT0_9VIBR|nr:hypothetical protein VHP8226_01936 [Vibrio hippocampi]